GTTLEAGWRQLKWADRLSLFSFYNESDKDLQHNVVMTVPFGEITSSTLNYGGLLRWQKKNESSLTSDVALGYARNEVGFNDVSLFFYDWFGNRRLDDEGNVRVRNTPGELGSPREQQVWDNNYFLRSSLSYTVNSALTLHFSSAPSYVDRNGENRRIVNRRDQLTAKQNAFTWVNGLEAEWKKGRIENRLFIKNYYQDVAAEEFLVGDRTRDRGRNSHNMGFGNNFRVKLDDKTSLKATYEWTARMPRVQEIFGNGAQILANLELEPERSHNANLELTHSIKGPVGSSSDFTINGFLRAANQLIVLLTDGQLFQFQNVFEAYSVGAEVTYQWSSPDGRFRFNVNGTWQEFRNNSSEGAFANVQGDRIPNLPFVYANSAFNYVFPELFQSNDRLSFFLNSRYVHEFFRTWESIGLSQFEETVPTQFVHNLGGTYQMSLGNLVTTLTLEAQNITNAKVFDFFGVQRPRRNFSLKITTQF
ncbi:MAG: ligand-gated channel protein, partial [Bacteroidota bacterium]